MRLERAVLVATLAAALAGCHASYFFPGPRTSPQDFSPGIWQTEDSSFSVELRADGTGQVVGLPEEKPGQFCLSPWEIDDPERAIRVSWEFIYEIPSSDSSLGTGGSYVSVERPEALWSHANMFEAESGSANHWGALWYFPCDPDLGYLELFKVEPSPLLLPSSD